MMFSWLGELVPVFWLMELGLLFLKSSAVSSSRFWAIKGFSVSLGSPSGFGSARHISFLSHFKVVLSVYFHSCPNCLWNLCQCFCFLAPLCTAGGSMLGKGLCGSFLSSMIVPSASKRLVWTRDTFMGFLWSPELALCIRGLVCTYLFSLGPPSVSS